MFPILVSCYSEQSAMTKTADPVPIMRTHQTSPATCNTEIELFAKGNECLTVVSIRLGG